MARLQHSVFQTEEAAVTTVLLLLTIQPAMVFIPLQHGYGILVMVQHRVLLLLHSLIFKVTLYKPDVV